MQLNNLPTELLVKLMSYLPTCDKVTMRYVSRRFKDVSETPSLWREFVWLDYQPRHVHSVSSVLQACGEHVRKIFFPAHVEATKILEMVHCCTKLQHLCLPEGCRLFLSDLREVVQTLTHLQQLDVFTDWQFLDKDSGHEFCWMVIPWTEDDYIEMLQITSTRIRKLNLHTNHFKLVTASIEKWAKKGCSLPLVVNFKNKNRKTFKFWSSVPSFKLPPFEISLYHNGMPMNPAVLQRKFQSGPSAKPPFIQLSNHGIVGLKYDVFHLREYDHHGTVRCTINHPPSELKLCRSLIEGKHLSYHLNSVSHADISNSGVCPDHLEQLAVACPNLEQLILRGNVDCLEDLQGLRAIVHACQNLTTLDLSGIPVSSVESCLLLWELLSSLKKLVIDFCVLQLPDCSKSFSSCQNLKYLNLCCDEGESKRCVECIRSQTDILSQEDLLFSSPTHHITIMYIYIS